MRTAKTILTVIQERGKQKKPIERVYKLLFNRELYLNAYAKLYPNNGAMTKGVTDEIIFCKMMIFLLYRHISKSTEDWCSIIFSHKICLGSRSCTGIWKLHY